MNIYQENGYKDRLDYLTCLSEDYGCPLENVLGEKCVYWQNNKE